MPTTILAETAAGLAELKNDPLATVASGDGFPVTILDHNEPAFYCISAKAYEILLDKLEDAELAAIVESRQHQPETDMAWDRLAKQKKPC
ncbi:MAG: type II toxin-antitoxin system Phd/YefM family antitoxin [Methylovulum sp.]|nr:type II toxin-antitoxin system Phd/YefM family antitoxin [Methylovulum sp.]